MVKLVLALLCTLSLTACASQSGPPTYNATPDTAADTITIKPIAQTVTFDITSPSGIGKARIKRSGGDAPTQIQFVLHLKGLENFTLTDASRQYQVSIPSGGGPIQTYTGPLNGELGDAPVMYDEPYYMDVKIFGTSQTTPLTDGYIQVTAPASLIKGGANDFSISWIDFYR